MMSWQLQEAKTRLGAVVDAAMAGEPQQITQRGTPLAVVVAAEDYERLRRLAKSSPPSFNELLLQMPQDDGEFAREPLHVRRFDT